MVKNGRGTHQLCHPQVNARPHRVSCSRASPPVCVRVLWQESPAWPSIPTPKLRAGGPQPTAPPPCSRYSCAQGCARARTTSPSRAPLRLGTDFGPKVWYRCNDLSSAGLWAEAFRRVGCLIGVVDQPAEVLVFEGQPGDVVAVWLQLGQQVGQGTLAHALH